MAEQSIPDPKPYGYIYCVTNSVNGKRYVGMTTQKIAARWRHHLKLSKWGRGSTLHAAMRKHGVERFSVSPLAVVFSQEELTSLERKFILELDTLAETGWGYNRTEGGIGSQGAKHTTKTRRSMSVAAKRAWQAEEVRATHIASRLAAWTPERRAKQSEAMKGAAGAKFRAGQKPMPQELRDAVGERFRHYWASPEARHQASKRVKNRCQDPEYRARLSERAKALQASDEYRAKMSEAVRLAWARRKSATS